MIDWFATHPWQAAVAAPFLGAALTMLAAHARLSWALAMLAALGAAAMAVAARSYANEAAMAAAPLLAVLAAICLLAGGAALRDMQPAATPLAMALSLCVGGGWIAALFAADWIGFALAVETAWLASTGLVALSEANRGALNGALRMLVGGGVSAVLLLIGAGFVAHAGASLELGALADAQASPLCTVGLVLVLLALAGKAGLAPLHGWSGAVFGRVGGFAALFVGVVCMTGALAAAVRVGGLAAAAPELAANVSAALAALGAASVAIGSIQAMGAANLRRLAGYAFASQGGCVLLSVSLGSPAGLAAALVQLFALAAAMLALLGAAAAARESSLEALDGMGRRFPVAGVAVTAGALSLMGAPLTIGFLGRWRLIEAAVGAGWWWVAGVALLASLAAVFYGGRLIERVYFRRASRAGAAHKDGWRMLVAPGLAAAVFAIALGVEPSFLLDAAAHAAGRLFGTAP